ncbi:RNA polymerase sigma factor [Streptomyces sp. NBC_00328]|uniref:RNA polymerase sigma factor n=1 Tax=Streptomyces sp. NBC_00328 TaxID=2903646 RepID=UPI002E2877AD|nr:sigma-70 family RNA polymerase sigma factor [Streptomyces sp. NBC_00328]
MTGEEYAYPQEPGGAVDGGQQFAAFYTDQFGPLMRYLQRKVGRDDAGDLQGHVFEQFFLYWQKNPDHDNPVALLYWIASCRLNDHLRKAGRELTFEVADLEILAVGGGWYGEAGFEGIEVRLDLERALAELDERQRQALLLHYVAELSTKDCAAVLQVGVENMKKILSKARASLRQSPRMETYETVAAVKEVRR